MELKKFPGRGEIYLVRLDPTIGSEMNNTLPAKIISKNKLKEVEDSLFLLDSI